MLNINHFYTLFIYSINLIDLVIILYLIIIHLITSLNNKKKYIKKVNINNFLTIKYLNVNDVCADHIYRNTNKICQLRLYIFPIFVNAIPKRKIHIYMVRLIFNIEH